MYIHTICTKRQINMYTYRPHTQQCTTARMNTHTLTHRERENWSWETGFSDNTSIRLGCRKASQLPNSCQACLMPTLIPIEHKQKCCVKPYPTANLLPLCFYTLTPRPPGGEVHSYYQQRVADSRKKYLAGCSLLPWCHPPLERVLAWVLSTALVSPFRKAPPWVLAWVPSTALAPL